MLVTVNGQSMELPEGGRVTDWGGRPLRWAPPPGATSAADLRGGFPGEVLAAGDARAHAQALQLLDWR